MEALIYLPIFIIGTLFGSFFSLAIYRIPIDENITYKRSFCPKCNHKLGFFDLIPILSYVFLKGKCRYCGQKIRIRYLLLELFSGIAFVLMFMSLNINILNIDVDKLIYFVILCLFFVTTVLIAGIDKENIEINKKVFIFGMFTAAAYILYLYIVEKCNIYRYAIYLGVILFLIIIDTLTLKLRAKTNYTIQVLFYSVFISLFLTPELFGIVVIITLLCTIIKIISTKINFNAESTNILEETKDSSKKVPIGFYLSISAILVIIIDNFFTNYLM